MRDENIEFISQENRTSLLLRLFLRNEICALNYRKDIVAAILINNKLFFYYKYAYI